jgi:hypothetical protein
MERLFESFSALKEEFVDDPAILGTIDHEIKLARECIAEMDDEPKEDRPAPTFGEVDSPDNPAAEVAPYTGATLLRLAVKWRGHGFTWQAKLRDSSLRRWKSRISGSLIVGSPRVNERSSVGLG